MSTGSTGRNRSLGTKYRLVFQSRLFQPTGVLAEGRGVETLEDIRRQAVDMGNIVG